jgi:hypothetical protein
MAIATCVWLLHVRRGRTHSGTPDQMVCGVLSASSCTRKVIPSLAGYWRGAGGRVGVRDVHVLYLPVTNLAFVISAAMLSLLPHCYCGFRLLVVGKTGLESQYFLVLSADTNLM